MLYLVNPCAQAISEEIGGQYIGLVTFTVLGGPARLGALMPARARRGPRTPRGGRNARRLPGSGPGR
jgi:hypothetical protein